MQIKGDGANFDAIAASAAHVIKRRFYYDHGASAADENRGIVADWDRRAPPDDWGQRPSTVHSQRYGGISGAFRESGAGDCAVHRRRFWAEDYDVLSGEMLAPWLSMKLRIGRLNGSKIVPKISSPPHRTRPNPLRRNGARRRRQNPGRARPFFHDAGAYAPTADSALNSQCTLPGSYDIPAYYSSTFTSVFTNKPIVTPYRGAGRQHGVL